MYTIKRFRTQEVQKKKNKSNRDLTNALCAKVEKLKSFFRIRLKSGFVHMLTVSERVVE